MMSCSQIPGIGGLFGGPKVAANVQAGQENHQTIGTSTVVKNKLEAASVDSVDQSTGKSGVRAGSVEKVEVNEGWTHTELLILLIAAFLDSPVRWPGQILSGFKLARERRIRKEIERD